MHSVFELHFRWSPPRSLVQRSAQSTARCSASQTSLGECIVAELLCGNAQSARPQCDSAQLINRLVIFFCLW
jgi:hypothetical protein